MTRSELVDLAWNYPFFEALALKSFVGEIFFALVSRPSLLRLRTRSASVGKLPIGHVWCASRDFAAVANLQQSAQFVLALRCRILAVTARALVPWGRMTQARARLPGRAAGLIKSSEARPSTSVMRQITRTYLFSQKLASNHDQMDTRKQRIIFAFLLTPH